MNGRIWCFYALFFTIQGFGMERRLHPALIGIRTLLGVIVNQSEDRTVYMVVCY